MLDIAVKKLQGSFRIDVAFVSEGPGVTALFGRSGAGKSSIVSMVAGLVKPDEGRIVVAGRTLFDSRQAIDLRPEKRRLGYVFQDPRLFPHFSVRSNLIYGMKLVPQAERRIGFDRVVDLLGIGNLLDRRPATLSGGERQRVAIGRALLTSPRLLLMDEPLASLDGARKAELLSFVARLPRELSIPILYVSHAFDELLSLADRVVLLDSGRLVGHGSVEEIAARSDLESLTGRFEMGAIICTTVNAQDEPGELTMLRFPGGTLRVPRLPLPVGTAVRVHIHARDVGICLERPGPTTILNVFPARIHGIQEPCSATCNVTLDVGCPLFARISSFSRAELALEAGQEVFVIVKKVSVSAVSLNESCGESGFMTEAQS